MPQAVRSVSVLMLISLVSGSVPAIAQPTATETSNTTEIAPVVRGSQPVVRARRINWARIELKGSYAESTQMPGLLGEMSESLQDILARFDKAAEDTSISGVILTINEPSLGWGRVFELQTRIQALRTAGKRVLAVIDSADSKQYLLASSCDEIIMPESGTLMLLGLRAEVMFYKNLFDKLGVQADMLRVGEFKSAGEPYTRSSMSPQFREEMEAVLDDYHRQLVEQIAVNRKLDKAAVESAINSGPYTAAAAQERRLIDRVAYVDQVEADLQTKSAESSVRFINNYGRKSRSMDFSGLTGMINMMNLMMGIEPAVRVSNHSKVAVINASGAIMTGRSQSSPFGGGSTLGSETLIKAIQKAGTDGTVKAIVIRIDSPGGSALASDLIWQALKTTGKPVVASMGDTAASGGYYIAMGADKIYAEPGTLTGSIGVVGGKLAIGGLLEKVGVTTSVIKRGDNSGLLSMVDGFSESERTAMQNMLNEIYRQFTQKAADGRGMPYDKLEQLARGRVYTGAMAKDLGLIDELGTLDDAVAHAATLGGFGPDEKYERLLLPKPASPLEMLLGPLDPNARLDVGGRSALAGIVPNELFDVLDAAGVIRLLARERILAVMPFGVSVK